MKSGLHCLDTILRSLCSWLSLLLLLATGSFVCFQVIIQAAESTLRLAILCHMSDEVLVKLCSLPFVSLACHFIPLCICEIFELLALWEKAWGVVKARAPVAPASSAPASAPTSA